ncbi:MAG: tol-pal system protein YbgF [Syntrophobacterales bacterium]|nr:tol-pal system protein YbgF [Syntrophobacterales bacterium]
MKAFIKLCLLLCLVVFFAGCATTTDLRRLSAQTQDELNQRLKQQQREIDHLKESLASLQKSHGDVGLDVSSFKDYLQEIQDLNDRQRKDATSRLNRKDDEVKELKEKQDRLVLKMNFLETYLGLGEKDRLDAGSKAGSAKDGSSTFSDREQAYAAAYELFKDGAYDKARGQFQDFLKNFPGTEYSDSAQFWIGECYYVERNYEQAILEYDKVIKNYSSGGKAAPALLKQGLSFVNIGDRVSGRLILQKVIKNYPNTSHAKVARAKLLEMK